MDGRAAYPAHVALRRPPRPRPRTVGIGGLGLLAGLTGGVLAGLLRTPKKPGPRPLPPAPAGAA